MTEREVYFLHVTNDGKEQRTMLPPKEVRSLRVEILDQDEREILERTFTIDRDGQPVEPRTGLNQDRWIIDAHGPADDGSTPWLRVRTNSNIQEGKVKNVKRRA